MFQPDIIPSAEQTAGDGTIPSLSTVHSGVPDRLADVAVEVKARVYANRTRPESVLRQRRCPLPPGISLGAFDAAISELEAALGDNNVERNDRPLVDGWYMQHPYVAMEHFVCFTY